MSIKHAVWNINDSLNLRNKKMLSEEEKLKNEGYDSKKVENHWPRSSWRALNEFDLIWWHRDWT